MDRKENLKQWFIRTWRRISGAVDVTWSHFMHDNILIASTGMVYSTLMALIPALTFIFSFLGAFGVLQPFLETIGGFLVEHLGIEQTREIMGVINKYTSNAMSLGVIGLISFLVTMILLVNKTMIQINTIFKTGLNANPIRRIVNIIAFLILSVLFLAGYFSILSSIREFMNLLLDIPLIQDELWFLNLVMRIVILWAFLFFIIWGVPNTKVKFSCAFIASGVGTFVMIFGSRLFMLIMHKTVKYSAIYGSFAIVFLFLFFCQMVWVVLFACVELAYVLQFKPDAVGKKTSRYTFDTLSDSVNVLMFICRKFDEGRGATSYKELVIEYSIPSNPLYRYLDFYQRNGYILAVNNSKTRFVPARPTSSIDIPLLMKQLTGTVERDSCSNIGEKLASDYLNMGIGAMEGMKLDKLMEADRYAAD